MYALVPDGPYPRGGREVRSGARSRPSSARRLSRVVLRLFRPHVGALRVLGVRAAAAGAYARSGGARPQRLAVSLRGDRRGRARLRRRRLPVAAHRQRARRLCAAGGVRAVLPRCRRSRFCRACRCSSPSCCSGASSSSATRRNSPRSTPATPRPSQVGSALTIANCIGFGISIVSIQLLNLAADTLRRGTVPDAGARAGPRPACAAAAALRRRLKLAPAAGSIGAVPINRQCRVSRRRPAAGQSIAAAPARRRSADGTASAARAPPTAPIVTLARSKARVNEVSSRSARLK